MREYEEETTATLERLRMNYIEYIEKANHHRYLVPVIRSVELIDKELHIRGVRQSQYWEMKLQGEWNRGELI